MVPGNVISIWKMPPSYGVPTGPGLVPIKRTRLSFLGLTLMPDPSASLLHSTSSFCTRARSIIFNLSPINQTLGSESQTGRTTNRENWKTNVNDTKKKKKKKKKAFLVQSLTHLGCCTEEAKKKNKACVVLCRVAFHRD